MKDRKRKNHEKKNEDVAFIIYTMGDKRLTQMKIDELSQQFNFVAFENDNHENNVQKLLKKRKIIEKNNDSENVQKQLKYY